MIPFSKQEKIELWANFTNMPRVRELIISEVAKAKADRDTLVGVKPEEFLKRQGIVEGLGIALSILEKKPSDL